MCHALIVIISLSALSSGLPIDFDSDGDIDQSDFGRLQACLSGTDNPQTNPSCLPADIDQDDDVDQDDYVVFEQCALGPGIPVPADCPTKVVQGCRISSTNWVNAYHDMNINASLMTSHISENFSDYFDGDDPIDWLDTDVGSSTVENDTLFKVHSVEDNQVFGTLTTEEDIHSHYIGADTTSWSSYQYAGRMMITDSASGIGVTFMSDYPNSDSYYRLRRTASSAFHISPHPWPTATVTGGTTDSGIFPVANQWYRFTIQVEDDGAQTFIKAKVWADGAPEPTSWQIDCYDANPTRRTSGTVGLWCYNTGSKYWDDLTVTSSTASQSNVVEVEFDAIPNDDNMDGVVALSAEPMSTFSDGAILVRFNDSGMIDARNGTFYRSNASIPYSAGINYHFRLAINLPTRKYNAYVTPEGSTEQTLATNYEFRTEQNAVSNLSNWAVWALGGTSHYVCSLAVNPDTPLIADAGRDRIIPPGGAISLGGDAFGGTGDYTYTWTPASGLSDSIIPKPTASPVEKTIYTLNVTDSGGKNASDIVTVHVPLPIARWDVVPNQRIDTGETFNCGVVAFSKFGIDKVTFVINGQGYTGPPSIDVTEMTYNDRTNVYEYWTPIAAENFTSDGPITVEATVHDMTGGIRDKGTCSGGQGLDALTLFVNPNGTLPQPEAWVATDGNDVTGQVNDSGTPFATVNKAIDAIRTWMNANGHGDKVDGGIVRLYPGTHATSSSYMGAMACENEWITVTTAAGGTRADTILTASSAIYNIQRARLKGITLRRDDNIVIGSTTELRYWMELWIDDCNVIGKGRYVIQPNPMDAIPFYFTDSYITEVRRGHTMQGAGNTRLVRGTTIETISEDAFQAVPLIINCQARDLDPDDFRPWGPDADIQHSDAWQSPGYGNIDGMQNWIVYGFRATDLHYQGLFSRTAPLSANIAFVNVFVEMRPPSRADSITKGSTFCGEYDHLLFWNCTFIGTDGLSGGFDFSPEPTTGLLRITNASFRGNLWQRWTTTEAITWTQAPDIDFYDNHYYDSSPFKPDTAETKTTGDL